MPSSRQQQQNDLKELGLTHEDISNERTIRKAYLRQSMKRHPDKGGTKEDFQLLSNAYQHLLKATNNNSNGNSNNGTKTECSSSTAYSQHQQETSHRNEHSDNDYHDDKNKNNYNYNDSENDNFWNDEFFYFFRRAWSSNGGRGGSYQEREYYQDFANWEAATAQERARRRYQNVKNGYDYRDKRVDNAALLVDLKTPKCSFCQENWAITKQDAKEHGLNWREYNSKRGKSYGLPKYYTCWACKNSHRSVITQNMAMKSKFIKNKNPALSGQHHIFDNLRRFGRSFHHQPVTDHAEATKNTEYFWYPDVEKQARIQGWTPRGEKRLENGQNGQNNGSLPRLLPQPKTPKRKRNAPRSSKTIVVTPSLSETAKETPTAAVTPRTKHRPAVDMSGGCRLEDVRKITPPTTKPDATNAKTAKRKRIGKAQRKPTAKRRLYDTYDTGDSANTETKKTSKGGDNDNGNDRKSEKEDDCCRDWRDECVRDW